MNEKEEKKTKTAKKKKKKKKNAIIKNRFSRNCTTCSSTRNLQGPFFKMKMVMSKCTVTVHCWLLYRQYFRTCCLLKIWFNAAQRFVWRRYLGTFYKAFLIMCTGPRWPLGATMSLTFWMQPAGTNSLDSLRSAVNGLSRRWTPNAFLACGLGLAKPSWGVIIVTTFSRPLRNLSRRISRMWWRATTFWLSHLKSWLS